MQGNIKVAITSCCFGEFCSGLNSTLFISLSPIITSVLLPADSLYHTPTLVYTLFLMMFAIRPISALVFGHFGDSISRNRTLATAFYLSGFATVLTGLLPSYEYVGYLSLVLLITIQLSQGVTISNELPGSMILLYETTKDNYKRWIINLSWIGPFTGIMIAALWVFGLHHFVSDTILHSYGWRLPFFIGLFVILLGRTLKKRAYESPAFDEYKQQSKLEKAPITSTLRANKKQLLYFFCCNAQAAAVSYFLIIFASSYKALSAEAHASALNYGMFFNTSAILFVIFAASYLLRRYGKNLILASSIFTLIVLYPALQLMENMNILGALLLIIPTGISMSALPELMLKQTAINLRYTTISLCYNLAYGIIGGCTPLICSTLVKYTGSLTTVSWYLGACCLLTITGILFARKRQRETALPDVEALVVKCPSSVQT